MFDGVNSFRPSDRFAYVENFYGLKYDDRWTSLGWMCVWMLIFQLGHFAALRFVKHATR